MAQIKVVPDGSGWKVMKNGRRVYKKTYPTKQKALNAAKRAASMGDSIQPQGRDGNFQKEMTYDTPGPRGDT